tara:strand:- start:1579 stop:2145 length:567 start_codon:yes stop_codon:yes gene_type:complete
MAFNLKGPHKFSFRIECQDSRLGIPGRLIVGRQDEESEVHVVLKVLSYLIFYRHRLQIGGHLFHDNIPFLPDLLQLDYEGHPGFWAECGPSEMPRLKKIVAKAPNAEIWWVRERMGEMDAMKAALKKAGVRPERIRLLGLPGELVASLCHSLQARNEIFWMPATMEPPELQFDFNQEWIQSGFELGRY